MSGPVSLLDLYPTLIDLTGLPSKTGLDGVSLTSLLRDPESDWDRPVVTTYGVGNHAVRTDRWRYIRYADGTEELYDHHDDPNEWTNVVGSNAGVAADLRRHLPRNESPPIETLAQ